MKKKYYIALLSFSLFLISCNHRTTSAYYNWETIFVKSEFGGAEVYKYYAAGRNKEESINQAEIDILKNIIFKGVSGAPESKPLVFEVNAEEKYHNYFNSFFSENGEYKKYVSLYRKGNINRNDRLKTGRRNDRKKKGIEILVKRSDLQIALINANIIKPKNN
jgi:hypothetical protein